ncbi:Mur ligase family protein [Defluviimonas aestuarii]|uniref:Mur ligase family protein n=1 Tax=Albidovulum aestuarii TaxID=1130726 RepID=UPI00249ABA90|nr:Mur ligase family protein [Defluviimonas aestuarii]MDI3337182.1 Mur ligase family protein [Defluviimonas aestuarii]
MQSDALQDVLDIPVPDHPALVLDGCRRLLGPNLYGREPGAVGDGLASSVDPDVMLQVWVRHTRDLLDGLGWTSTPIRTRPFEGGASLFFPAAVDQLFTAAFIVEAAWYYTATELLGLDAIPRDRMRADLDRIARAEANPKLAALVSEATQRGVDRLLDDDALTLGHGTGSDTWTTTDLPPSPNWSRLHDIPLALVTGTNGKTTTTRLIAAMARAAGQVAGLSSTEFVRVGDDILDRGDYSGPAGARLLLRDKRLEIGVLEVARGGILRRGVPVTRARAAVVTNVAADHLGQYGINTVAELARVKLAVHRALAPDGVLILNADDPQVVEAAREADASKAWFSLRSDNAEIRAARSRRDPCAWLDNDQIVLADGTSEIQVIAVADVPLTLGGAARYNIENVLGAALAARALGLPDAAIRTALSAFRSDPIDNPGRANEFSVRGARVFVDFAHNPHSIAAVTSALATIPAQRRFVLLTHAGDRSDEDIRALTRGAFQLRPDVVVAAENPKYLRGRQRGEIPALIRQQCLDLGLTDSQVILADSPSHGASLIVEKLAPGDVALLLVHDERQKVVSMLQV